MADAPQESQIAPALLIAVPQLRDPNFVQTVVLLIHHDAEGAFGLVLNRPSEIDVETVCAEFTDQPPSSDQPVFVGGPVERIRGFLLYRGAPVGEADRTILEDVVLSGDPERLLECCREARAFRLYVGYAGWGPGQLEQELSAGAWLVLPASAEVVFETPPEAMWEVVLRRNGIDPATIAQPGSEPN